MARRTEADRWLEGYANEYGYTACFEPPWERIFGRTFGTNPDFLIERDGERAVAEVMGIRSQRVLDYLDEQGGTAYVPPRVDRAPIARALRDKADQLAPFAVTGAPLVIVLARAPGSDLSLGSDDVQEAMFGGLVERFFVPLAEGVEVPPRRSEFAVGKHAVFRTPDGQGGLANPRPHISAVVVVFRHDFGPRPAHGVDVYDLNRYVLGHGPPLPEDWFSGPLDSRFGFNDDGTGFGLIRGRPGW
jgi:hypothetical protein